MEGTGRSPIHAPVAVGGNGAAYAGEKVAEFVVAKSM